MKILGTEYRVKTDRNWEEIQQLSSRLEKKMEEIQKNSPFLSLRELSVLSALSLLEEIEETRKKEAEVLKNKICLLIEKLNRV